MSKPVVIIDAHWREMGELFADTVLADLREDFDVVWGEDAPIPENVLRGALPHAVAWIAATPKADAALLALAPNLRAIIEVSGSFPDSIDYAACAERGVEVLSCAPGFREGVAEMALGMALSGCRGLVAEHEAFREGQEGWLQDRVDRDFTLFDAPVGFLGFGAIGQTIAGLLAPFRTEMKAHDPWLPPEVAAEFGVELAGVETVLQHARCLFVVAAPTVENKGVLNGTALSHLPDGALVVVVSRAHLVDFPDLLKEVRSGRLRAAIDVFPDEPVDADDPIRATPGLILSPHRAAAVKGGRHLIGRLILQDLAAILEGRSERGLQRANLETVAKLAGVGDAKKVSNMAVNRS